MSSHYDEVLVEVSSRIADRGSISKSDIGALLFWKRLRANTPWVGDLLALPKVEVRAVTVEAVQAVNGSSLTLAAAASQGQSLLSSLPGFSKGDPIASALLPAAAPTRMAVYDRRAHTAQKHLGLKLIGAPGRYGRYMGMLDDLLHDKPDAAVTWFPPRCRHGALLAWLKHHDRTAVSTSAMGFPAALCCSGDRRYNLGLHEGCDSRCLPTPVRLVPPSD